MIGNGAFLLKLIGLCNVKFKRDVYNLLGKGFARHDEILIL